MFTLDEFYSEKENLYKIAMDNFFIRKIVMDMIKMKEEKRDNYDKKDYNLTNSFHVNKRTLHSM